MNRRDFIRQTGLLGLGLLATGLGCTPATPGATGASASPGSKAASPADGYRPGEVTLGSIVLLPYRIDNDWIRPCEGQAITLKPGERGTEALFSTIGFTYGGNGKDSFHLPDLRDKVPGMTYHMLVQGIYPRQT